jgi:hypothetical protein
MSQCSSTEPLCRLRDFKSAVAAGIMVVAVDRSAGEARVCWNKRT